MWYVVCVIGGGILGFTAAAICAAAGQADRCMECLLRQKEQAEKDREEIEEVIEQVKSK